MASVDFKKGKLHTIQAVRNLIKHCDAEQRLQSDHKNKHIDKSRTNLNKQFNLSYEQTVQKFKDKLLLLDAKPGANRRKDRVIAFMLEVPIPAGIPYNKAGEFGTKVNQLINEQYGKGCIINGYIHRDEVHTYIDAETKEERTSLNHIHILTIPVVNGSLNGKEFSSAKNMRKLNKAIDEMCKSDYGISFLTGASKKSREDVETLKLKSERAELENDKADLEHRIAFYEADYEIKMSHVAKHKEENIQKENELKVREEALKLKEQELNEKIQLFNKLNISLQDIRRKIKAEDQKRIDDAVQMAHDAVPSMVAEPTRANDVIPDFVKE